MITVALTGGNGLVGSRIKEVLADKLRFIDLPQKQMDITDEESVKKSLASIDFDVFLHLAAYTLVDKAEEEKELARNINVNGTKYVFETVSQKKKPFILFSTDFVFDGTNPPYTEDSPTHPLGQYALTKYESEKIVGTKGMIIRISYPYRATFEPKKDFVRSLRFALSENKELYMIKDSLITPTFIDDIAYGLLHLIQHYEPTTFHLVGSQNLSPYEAAIKIAQTYKLDESLIHSVSFEEYSKGRAKRSQYSAIKSKRNDFYPMKTFDEGLREMLTQSA